MQANVYDYNPFLEAFSALTCDRAQAYYRWWLGAAFNLVAAIVVFVFAILVELMVIVITQIVRLSASFTFWGINAVASYATSAIAHYSHDSTCDRSRRKFFSKENP